MPRTREARITYTPRPGDATPEGELNALAAVYKFILEKEGRPTTSGPDDAEGESNGIRATEKYTRSP